MSQELNTDESEKWSEKRRFPRYRTDLPLKVRSHLELELGGRCNVIAEGGLGAILAAPIPVGSVVQLGFSVPTHPTFLLVWAVVRYQHGLQHGFEFVSLTDVERLSIRQFCTELATQSSTQPEHSRH